ncbi:MAG: hypothetical protein ACRDD1_20855, partial [Planctomycetia bacterium]
MATAVQPNNTAANESNPQTRLAMASLVGAAFVVFGAVAAVYLLPFGWDKFVAPALATVGDTTTSLLLLVAQIAAAFGVITLGNALAGANPPKGIRGGIFLTISVAVTTFFVARVAWILLDQSGAQSPVTLAVIGAGLFGAYRAVISVGVQSWMVHLEEQGWFHTFAYKRTQGQKV